MAQLITLKWGAQSLFGLRVFEPIREIAQKSIRIVHPKTQVKNTSIKIKVILKLFNSIQIADKSHAVSLRRLFMAHPLYV
jgi:hypothetical protein